LASFASAGSKTIRGLFKPSFSGIEATKQQETHMATYSAEETGDILGDTA